MPSRTTLRVGDRIRILSVPTLDLRQMADAMKRGDPLAQWTSRVLQRLADRKHCVRIDEIDEYATPWFSYSFKNKMNAWEHHRLAIMEDESWEMMNTDISVIARKGTSS